MSAFEAGRGGGKRQVLEKKLKTRNSMIVSQYITKNACNSTKNV